MTFKCGRQFNKIPQISIRSTSIFHMNWINTKYSIFPQNWAETMPCCEISDCAQMSKTIIAVRHFGLGGRESLETAVITYADISMGNFLFEVLTWYLARPHCCQLNPKVKKSQLFKFLLRMCDASGVKSHMKHAETILKGRIWS